MQRFRSGLVFKAHRLCVSLNSRLESNKERFRGGLVFKADRLCASLNSRPEISKEEEVPAAPPRQSPLQNPPPPLMPAETEFSLKEGGGGRRLR